MCIRDRSFLSVCFLKYLMYKKRHWKWYWGRKLRILQGSTARTMLGIIKPDSKPIKRNDQSSSWVCIMSTTGSNWVHALHFSRSYPVCLHLATAPSVYVSSSIPTFLLTLPLSPSTFPSITHVYKQFLRNIYTNQDVFSFLITFSSVSSPILVNIS